MNVALVSTFTTGLTIDLLLRVVLVVFVTSHKIPDVIDNILINVDRNSDGDVSDPEDIPGKRVQFKEISGVGFSYKF